MSTQSSDASPIHQHNVLSMDAPPPASPATRVAPEWDAIIAWCLNKDAQARLHSEIAQELGVHLSCVTRAYLHGYVAPDVHGAPRLVDYIAAMRAVIIAEIRANEAADGARRRARAPDQAPRRAQGQARQPDAADARPALPRAPPWFGGAQGQAHQPDAADARPALPLRAAR